MRFVRIGLYRLLLFLLIIPIASWAETFKNPQLIPTGSNPTVVIEGDLNGDGRPDLIYADATDTASTVHVLLNQGNNAFVVGQNIGSPPPNPFLACYAVADINNDGNADLICIATGAQNPALTVALGNGDGTFQPLLTTALSYYNHGNPDDVVPKAATIADVNGDGIEDFLFADAGNAVTFVCLGDNTGHFLQQFVINDQNAAFGIFLGDFNRDGKTDIILNEYLAARGAVFLNSGDGTFTFSSYITSPNAIEGMAVGDFDGDGYPDVIINDSLNVLHLLHGNGDATYTPTFSFTAPVANTLLLADILDVNDYNHDGVLDLALETPDGVHILIGQGNFVFAAFQPAPVTANPRLAAIGDLNHDTSIDFVFPAPGGLAILYGQPDGSLYSADAYDTRYLVRGAALADFNGDGRQDAVVSVNDVYPRVLAGNANGSFTFLPDPNTPSSFIHDQNSITVGDFNGDGRADYVSSASSPVLSQIQGAVYALGKGDGTFGALNTVPGFTDLSDVGTAVGDLNNDGRTDIAASEIGLTQQGFFLGQPDGSVRQSTTLYSPFLPFCPWVYGDFNKDGYRDAAIVGGGEIQIENGKGDGTFTPGFIYTAGASPTLGSPSDAIAVDVDGDGNIDILSPIDFNVQVFFGRGDGTFATPVFIPLAPLPSSASEPEYFYSGINAADFNGDGILDLALTNGNFVTIVHGVGNRQFGASENYLAGNSNGAPLIADFNGDGRPDIMISNNTASTVTVFLNIADAGDVLGKLIVTPEPSTFPQSFSIHFNVSAAVAASGIPTGTVSFSLDGASIGTVTISNATASLVVNTQVPVGTHVVTAAYSGDLTFHPATFSVQHTVVAPAAATQTALTVTPNPSSYGLPVKLSATVSSASPIQGGSIAFMDGTTVVATQAIGQNGSAKFSTSAFQVGTHALSATYSGAAGFQSSTSNTISLVVQPDATSTALTSAPNPALVGTNVTFTASVTNTIAPAAAPLSGNVTFSDGPMVLGQATLNGSGVATFTTNSLAVGTHAITASYPGTTNTQPSVSAAVQQVIVAIVGDFMLDVTPGSASVYTGVAAKFHVTVTAVNGFNQTVALTCSGLPAETTCVFKPASIPGGNGLAQLTIQTSPPHPIKAARNSAPFPWKPVAATGAGLSLAFLILPRRMRALRLPLTLAIGLLLTSTMGACGGPGPAGGGTPPGNYKLSINGSAPPLTHATVVPLTVKSFF